MTSCKAASLWPSARDSSRSQVVLSDVVLVVLVVIIVFVVLVVVIVFVGFSMCCFVGFLSGCMSLALGERFIQELLKWLSWRS